MANNTYFDDCQFDTQQDVLSAQKAFDYLAGKVRYHFEILLSDDNQGIKKWRERGVQPLWEEFLRSVISRSANTYQDDPKREIIDDNGDVNEVKTALYNEMLHNSMFTQYQDGFDEARRLGGAALVLVQYADEIDQLMPSILSRNICDVKWNNVTKQVEELIYTAGTCGPNGGQLFHIWTPYFIKDVERSKNEMRVIKVTPQPYGMVPVAYSWDIAPPNSSFWPKARWEHLTYANDAISMFHTQTKHAQKYQAFPSLFTAAELPSETVIGPDAIVTLKNVPPGESPYLEYKSATDVSSSLKAFMDWLDGLKKTIADQWGVNLRIDGNANSDSGFKLVVEEFPSLELRNKRIKTAIPFEKQLHKVYTTLADYHQLGDIKGTLRVDFKPPRLPVNDKEQWDIAQGKIVAGVWSVEDFWRYENPDITPEEIEEKKARIRQDKLGEAAGKLPTFQ